MQLDLVFELARLQDRPTDADGLMRHQLEYLASAACDRSGSERVPKVASYKKPITATIPLDANVTTDLVQNRIK